MQRTGRLTTARAPRVRRSRGARAVIVGVILFLGSALFRLQVLHSDENIVRAKNARLRELTIPAPRGTVYDRHGRVVADNVPGFQIQIMPGDSMEAQIERLVPLLGVTPGELRRARQRWSRQRHLPLVLMEDAPQRAVATLAERRQSYPSVLVHPYARRRYPAGEAIAHFIGYISEINEQDLSLPEFRGYEQGRWIGKVGLERQYEGHLGGIPGKRYVEVDANGRIQRWLPERTVLPPVPGRDLHLYLDLDLQEYIARIFPREYEGAIVALDPHTGGVLAYYSHPSYDPNLFIGGISNDDYTLLRDDPGIPLLDRVIQSKQPAASTWKLAVAGMALDLGVITPQDFMPQPCVGGISFQGRYARCHAVHGRQNLVEGIRNSCNVYFYQVGIRIGLRRMLEHGARLGFGESTGIDVPNEESSDWPDIGYWQRELNYAPAENEVMSLAIGQGPMGMTIIKLAHIYAALTAPNGRVPAPRLAMESRTPQDTSEFHTTPRDRWHLEAGMRRVVSPGGTAARSRLPAWDFIGKTGTAQVPSGEPHAWFVGTGAREVGAPPEIAVTMFLAHAEHGYTASGYVAEAINFYLSRKHGRPFTMFATERMRTLHGLPTEWNASPTVDPPMPAATPADRQRSSAAAARSGN